MNIEQDTRGERVNRIEMFMLEMCNSTRKDRKHNVVRKNS